MTESTTLVAVSPSTARSGERPENPPPELTAAEQDAVRELVRQARDRGVALTGPGGLLKAFTKTVIETALDEEVAEHVAMTSTHQRAVAGVTPATVNGPRRCSPMPAARWTSTCHGIGRARSSR